MEYGTFLGLEIEETTHNKQPQQPQQLQQPQQPQQPNFERTPLIHKPSPANQQLDRHTYPHPNSRPPELSYP